MKKNIEHNKLCIFTFIILLKGGYKMLKLGYVLNQC